MFERSSSDRPMPTDRAPGLLRTPRAYKVCDLVGEGLLYFAVVFSPWAFGTTQPWAIWTMTVTGWLLGLLLVGKWVIRWRTGYQPVRWESVLPLTSRGISARIPRGLTIVLAVLTVLILAYCLVSAWNARATYDPVRRAFTYHECLRWLPHSYDGASSWFVFAQLLGLAGFFWALRDWLLGLSAAERRAVLGEADQPRLVGGLPVRVKRLLWVLCGQGAVLALVAILNRLGGSEKILWMLKAQRSTVGFHFGPFAYRGNASQYLNLLWPVCLGFWWVLQHEAASRRRRTGRRASGAHGLLLPCTVLMAIGPVMSGSRGGLLVAMALGGVAACSMVLSGSRLPRLARVAVAGLLVGALGLGVYLGWDRLAARLSTATLSIPVDVELSTNDFALRVVFRPEAGPKNAQQTLVGVSASREATAWRPEVLNLGIVPSGNLHATLCGDSATNNSIKIIGQFMNRYATGVVDLVFLKTTPPRAYVNNVPVPLGLWPKGSEEMWRRSVGSSWFWVGGHHAQDQSRVSPILGAVLYNHANFPTNEIGLSLPSVADTLPGVGRVLQAVTFDFEAEGFTSRSTGLAITVEPSGRSSGDRGLRAAREASRGSWVLQKSDLTSVNPGPVDVRITLEAENPNATPCFLQVALGDRMRALQTLAAQTNTITSTVFQGVGEEDLARLTLAITDEQGRVRDDLPASFELRLSRLQVDQLGAVVALDFSDEPLTTRLNTDKSGREAVYAAARRIAEDFPWFGSGPGTFMTLAELYRDEVTGKWPAYVHDDWLETRVTLGWIGLGLAIAGLVVVAVRPLAGGGLPCPGILQAQCFAAMAGCLVHAKYDFPFQVYSILMLFLVLCGLVSVCGRGKNP